MMIKELIIMKKMKILIHDNKKAQNNHDGIEKYSNSEKQNLIEQTPQE